MFVWRQHLQRIHRHPSCKMMLRMHHLPPLDPSLHASPVLIQTCLLGESKMVLLNLGGVKLRHVFVYAAPNTALQHKLCLT